MAAWKRSPAQFPADLAKGRVPMAFHNSLSSITKITQTLRPTMTQLSLWLVTVAALLGSSNLSAEPLDEFDSTWPHSRYNDSRYDNSLYQTNYERPADRDQFDIRYDDIDRRLQTRLQSDGERDYRSGRQPLDQHEWDSVAPRDHGYGFPRQNLDRGRDRAPAYDYTPRREPVRPAPLPNDYRNDYRYEDRREPRDYSPYETLPRYEDRLPVERDYNYGPTQPQQPQQPQVRPEDQLSESEQTQAKLTARYGDPTVQRFVQSVSPQTAMALYQEASQLIDTRHMQPTSYDARVKQAARNLSEAVRNPMFLQAHRLQPSADQVRNFDAALSRLVQSTVVRDRNGALQMMNQTMQLAQQQMGIPAASVALEFVYASAESLDKYSTFLPEDPRSSMAPEFENLRSAATGLEENIVGIGVEIKPHDQGIEIVRPLRGGPAERVGVQKGDIIVAINGRRLAGQTLNFAVDQIAGPVGTPVQLSIVRNGQQLGPVTVTRQQVRVYSVSEVKMTGDSRNVGYIKLEKFAQSTSQEVDEALWQLHRQGMQSLIIDLRGNPGGLLTTAIELSDKFLPSGTIVSTRGRTAQDQMQETAKHAQTWKVPLVVLIDEDSASASEIFAAAIQENERGVIVGRTSYGKGTVQTHFPLRSVPGNLKLTTAKFYSPKGREMAGSGVTPDITVHKASYRPNEMASDFDRDIQAAVEVAQSDRVKDIASLAAGTNGGNSNGFGLQWPLGR